MSRRQSNEMKDDVGNEPIAEEIADKEPPRRPDLGDSYDQDFEEDDGQNSTKGVKNLPAGVGKSPKFNVSSKSKGKLRSNASMSSLRGNKKKSRGNSLAKSGGKSSLKISGKLNSKSKSKIRANLRDNLMKGSMRSPGMNKFNTLSNNPMTRSEPQFNPKFKIRKNGVKKAPMRVIEDSINKAK